MATSGSGRAHGDPDVRLNQGRGVVDAVAYHDHGAPPGLVGLYRVDLLLRQQVGAVADAEHLGDSLGGALIVAGEELDVADAEVADGSQGGGGFRAEGIGGGQNSCEFPVDEHEEERLSLLFQQVGLGRHRSVLQHSMRPHGDGAPLDRRPYSLSWYRRKVLGRAGL
jgi:hypothetical protein